MPEYERRYDREAAVSYAHRWSELRNPAYYNYDKLGGDCTNFASQCLYAGSDIMSYNPRYPWYYSSANNKSPSWTGVEFLFEYLVRGKNGPGPAAVEVSVSEVMPGDIVQLSFDGLRFQHTPFVVATGPVPHAGNILVAAHSIDCDNRPLGTYTYINARFLHITGVRVS